LKIAVLTAIILGSAIFGMFPILSSKFFKPTLMEAVKFNLMFLPLGLTGNMLLAWGFMNGVKTFGNTALLVGIQTGVCSLLVVVLSSAMLNQKISIYGVVGMLLIIGGVVLLNKSA
jgi:uncharacterized membrane protein